MTRTHALFGIAAAGAVVFGTLVAVDRDYRADVVRGWRWAASGFRHDDLPGRRPPILVTRDGRVWLDGGPDDADDFDVTTFRLTPGNLRFGMGREKFAALIAPEFDTTTDADTWLDPADRVLVAHVGDDARVYPLRLMRRHELVNDVVGGVPVFAAYCGLADLGAVYERTIDGHAHTFAVSGWTTSEPDVWDGHDAFVLWDRDTESLWWPPIGRAVSGPMVDRPLPLLDASRWSQTTWSVARTDHPTAAVLRPRQTLDPPIAFPRHEPPVASSQPATGIAPRWPATPAPRTPR